MPKPPIIAEIEAHYGQALELLAVDSIEALLRYGRKEADQSQYLLKEGQLVGLKLRSMGLSDFPFLHRPELHGLQALCLSENALETLAIPAGLSALQYLDLSDNTSLQSLSFEAPLPQLRQLDLSDSGLTALQLPECPELQHLDASRNKLTTCTWAAACPQLSWLDLSGNENLKALALPAGFWQLAHLHLNQCGLKQLDIAGALPALRVLDLEGNKLKQWPDGFTLPDGAETLYLNGNPLQDIPETIRGSGDRHNSCQDVRTYLSSIAKEEDTNYLHQAKLILVGNGEVGKSSIRIKLLDRKAPLPKKEDRTPGLEIAMHPYPLKALPPSLTGLEEPIDFQLNIWDFGGQSHYREIQQLFCTPKSLYIFVTACDDKPEDKDDYVNFDYWMAMVHALSYEPEKQQSSPVIHVVNKVDIARLDIDQPRHNSLGLGKVERFLEISCETLYHFDELEAAIREVLPKVGEDIFRDRFNKSWLGVKDTLQQRQAERHISLNDYTTICQLAGLNESEAATWLRTLHRIGAVIYFGQNEKLKDWIILDPNWVKNAIVEVLNCGESEPLSRNYFDRSIWQQGYTAPERDKLLALMEAYDLCYARTNDFGELRYVVPALLKDVAPNYQAKLPPGLPSLQLRFRYKPFLPAGSVNKLMVRLKDYIFQGLRWKNNVILHHPATATYAHLWEDWRAHCIYLQLYGTEPGPFYHELYAALHDLNDDFKNTHFLKHLQLEVQSEYEGEWLNKKLLVNLRPELLFLKQEPDIRLFKEFKTHLIPENMPSISQLIKNNNIEGALNALETLLPPEDRHEVTMLMARYNQMERDNRIGVLSPREVSMERNRIIDAILSLSKDIEQPEEVPEKPSSSPNPDRNPAPPEGTGKKKVLFICSSPDGTNPLDFGKEFKKINNARQLADHRDAFEELQIQTGVESDEFLNILTKYQPDILHISLHSSKSKGLYFEDIAGKVQPMPVEDFADVIEIYCKDPDGKGHIETVVLSACNSQLYGEAIRNFANNVIATNDFFPDKAAVVYADQFYKMLFNKKDVAFAHDSACLAIKRQKYDPEKAIHEIPILIKK